MKKNHWLLIAVAMAVLCLVALYKAYKAVEDYEDVEIIEENEPETENDQPAGAEKS